MIASLPLPSIYLPTEGNGPYPYDRRMVLQLQAHELALIDRLRARGTKTPKHRPKQTKAFNRYKSISSKLIIRKKPRGWFSTRPGPRPDTRRYGNDAKPSTGPLDGHLNLQSLRKPVNVYPDVEPLVYRLRPLAWRFALSFQSYGFLSPSSCWTDPLYLSFLSECFSKPSFFQNLLRSSFFLRTQGKEDEPYYCKTQKIEQKKYSLTEGAKRKRGDFATRFMNERKAGTKRDFNGDFPVVPAMRLLCCLTRKRERSSGLN
ncbi:hypothetical protein L1987_89531 [Smallanthus sonchifolius]|nr:hypothetical protein L1987_89531 [Smallanthus sonchifolius]